MFFKRFLAVLAGVMALAITTSNTAFAADETGGVDAKSGYDWSGIGIGVGGGSAAASTGWINTTINTVGYEDTYSNGFLGVYAGYDVQVSNIVLGVSGEYNWTAISGTQEPLSPQPGPIDSTSTKIDSFGSVNGRVGFALDRLLIYGTGGYSFASLAHDYNGSSYVDFGKRSFSGYNFGAGVDIAISEHIVGKLEYRRHEFNNEHYPAPLPGYADHAISLSMDVIKAGIGYKF